MLKNEVLKRDVNLYKKLSYRRETAVQGLFLLLLVLRLYINCFLTVTAAVIPVNCGNWPLKREGLLSLQNLR